MTLTPSDIAAIRAAETALTVAFEAPDPTAWVYSYTEDAIFAGPGAAAIHGRAALLAVAPAVAISSMRIDAESTFGAGDLASTFGRASWVNGRRAFRSHGSTPPPHGLAQGSRRAVAHCS